MVRGTARVDGAAVRGGGGFFDLAVHGVDLAAWLLGEPLAVTSARLTGAHHGSAALRSSGGVAIEIEAGWEAAGLEVACDIEGTRGSAQVRAGRMTSDVGIEAEGPEPGARDAIGPWLDALRGRQASLVPADDAVRAVTVVAALRAAAT